jgi:hypothetical protein
MIILQCILLSNGDVTGCSGGCNKDAMLCGTTKGRLCVRLMFSTKKCTTWAQTKPFVAWVFIVQLNLWLAPLFRRFCHYKVAECHKSGCTDYCVTNTTRKVIIQAVTIDLYAGRAVKRSWMPTNETFRTKAHNSHRSKWRHWNSNYLKSLVWCGL